MPMVSPRLRAILAEAACTFIEQMLRSPSFYGKSSRKQLPEKRNTNCVVIPHCGLHDEPNCRSDVPMTPHSQFFTVVCDGLSFPSLEKELECYLFGVVVLPLL